MILSGGMLLSPSSTKLEFREQFLGIPAMMGSAKIGRIDIHLVGGLAVSGDCLFDEILH